MRVIDPGHKVALQHLEVGFSGGVTWKELTA